jgi:hypothetical protein
MEWFLSILDIISWIPALGITRLTLVLSPLITIRTNNESHYAYWVYVADPSHGSSDEAGTRVNSDSFTNSTIWAPLTSLPVLAMNTWGHLIPTSCGIRSELHFTCGVGVVGPAPWSHLGCDKRLKGHNISEWKRSIAFINDPHVPWN